MGQVLIESFA